MFFAKQFYNLANFLCNFSFPKDPVTRRIWVDATKRINFNPSHHSVLCSEHFEEDQFEVGLVRRNLKRYAIPTKFNFSPQLERYKSQRKQVLFRTEVSLILIKL